MERKAGLIAAIFACCALTGCNEEDKQNADGSLSSNTSGRQMSVIGSLRPKADPSVLEKIREEDASQRRKAQEAVVAAQQQVQQNNSQMNPANRDLPAVDQNPISGIANALGFNNPSQPAQSSGSIPSSPSSQPSGIPMSSGAVAPPPPQQTAMYGGGYGGYGGGGGGGMIPPPPAVSLTTSAQQYTPQIDPNYQQYMQQGYGQQFAPPQQYAAPAAMPSHPVGSMFSNGGGSSASAPAEEKKKPAMVVITPTGMDARSPYKQRDDLKILVKGAFAATQTPELRDPKIALLLARADVGLPAEATKGNTSLSPRQLNSLFKNPPLDKKFVPSVSKIEQDVALSYFRYLSAYNKYVLTQQQVAARKQEVDVADSNAERQRAAADLSTSQSEADASKEDVRSAQMDLASIAGAQAARSVIAKVSGTAPSLDSLASAEPEPTAKSSDGGMLGAVGNAFGALNFWGKKKEDGGGGEKIASAPAEKAPKEKKEKDKDKGKDKSKDKKEDKKEEKKDKKDKDKKSGKDAPQQIASAPPAVKADAPPPEEKPAPAAAPSTGISFELKNVQTTPRKSVLKVAVKNNGGESFTLDPDVISVSEGDKRLAEASVMAQFDSTLVAAGSEVTGTITIFGRPWNDRLNVSLSDGGKTVQLRR